VNNDFQELHFVERSITIVKEFGLQRDCALVDRDLFTLKAEAVEGG